MQIGTRSGTLACTYVKTTAIVKTTSILQTDSVSNTILKTNLNSAPISVEVPQPEI